MIGWLVGLINPLGQIADKIVSARIKLKDAETEQKRIEADYELQQLSLQQKVLLEEQKNRATRWIRPAFAFPFIVYNFKVVVWDKVLGWGVTDNLSSDFWYLQMVIFGAYFVTRPFGRK